MSINLQELRYLVALADSLHFGRAATACGVSQPTLSTQLKKLEDFLGAPLFERTNKSVHITAFGEQVVVRARQVLAEVDAIVDMAQQQAKPTQRVIELGVIPTLCPYLLPWAMPVIRSANRDIRLNVYEDFTANLIERLIAHQLDAAIVSLPLPHRGFESLALFEEPFWFACAKENPLASTAPVTESEMRAAEMLILTEGHCMRDQMLSICDSAQVQVTGGDFRATSLETIRQMVAAGMGCTLLPALAVSQAQETGICVRPLTERSVRRIGFVWRGSYPGADDIVRLANTICANLPPSVRSLAAPA
jgi:LysR family hydrogen peroxide-inducible transcriptional activator